MALAGGPMKRMLQLAQTSAKWAFSARKPYPGMNGVHVADLGSADETVDLEIAVAARSRTDANGLVGELDVEAFFVGLRINGDRFDAHFAARAHDAEGDLATVGDEDFVEHELGKRGRDQRAGGNA